MTEHEAVKWILAQNDIVLWRVGHAVALLWMNQAFVSCNTDKGIALIEVVTEAQNWLQTAGASSPSSTTA